MNKAKLIQTTKWGTACAQCAAAKAKCSRQSEIPGSKCDRCERLLKTCTGQVQRPRKPRQSRVGSRKQSTSSSPCGDTCGSLSPPSNTSIASFTSSVSASNNDIAAESHFQHGPSRSNTSSPSLSVTFSPPPSVPRTSIPPIDNLNRPRSPSDPTADEDVLQTFLVHIQPSFPFILVPSNVNSQALAVERPLLMSAIRIAAATTQTSSDTSKVPESTLRRQVYQFVNQVSNTVLLRGEGNLETLMAVVVVLGRWRWWCARHGGRFNSLLAVAEALVGELGLNRNSRLAQEEEERVTDDEKRLLLGVWYLRSCAATHLSQLSPTVFTPYMLQCLNEIEMSSQPSDRVLVQAVKIQRLEERIARLNDELLAALPTLNPAEDEARVVRIAGLRNELELLNRGSAELMHNPLIASHLKTAFLRLHEPLLTHSPTVLTHLYASALGIHFTSGAPTAATIFQPFLDTWQTTILGGNARLTALPTPILTMHLSYFSSLLFQLCSALNSTSTFPGVQALRLSDSIREQLALLGVVVRPDFMALLLAVADAVTETSSLTTGGALASTEARIQFLLSTSSAFYPLVLGKWVSFAINGGVLPSMTSSQTSHTTTGLSSPPNLYLLSASAAGSPFPTTDSEYEDYELEFDVDVDMTLPTTQGMQYAHGGYHGQAQSQQHQGYGQQQMQAQPGQQWAATGGWPVSSPEENSGVALGAAMFWGQTQGHVHHTQGHHGHQHQHQDQGQRGWGQGR